MNQVLVISLFSGLATGIGGLIVLWFGQPTYKVLGFYLGISTGMMGMVVIADLLPASIQYGGITNTIIGLVLGILIMMILDLILKKSFKSENIGTSNPQNEKKQYRSLGYFMTIAIALHNIPEGLAIGAGFESQEELGIRVALVIALHNIPEGLGVASTLYLGRMRKLFVFLLPLSTGLFIPLGTYISQLVGRMIPQWISIGLSLASGAMAYIVIKDVGPQSMKLHRLLGQFGIGLGILILYIVYRLNS